MRLIIISPCLYRLDRSAVNHSSAGLYRVISYPDNSVKYEVLYRASISQQRIYSGFACDRQLSSQLIKVIFAAAAAAAAAAPCVSSSPWLRSGLRIRLRELKVVVITKSRSGLYSLQLGSLLQFCGLLNRQTISIFSENSIICTPFPPFLPKIPTNRITDAIKTGHFKISQSVK